ncbi:MAG: hypothetical protein IJ840_07135 [Bacteroidales bacterium]|nr:hypothetical protein [Bacteroidales bacterium]
MGSYTPVYSHNTNVYNLEGFTPPVVDKAYLKSIGVRVEPDPETLAGLERGSRIFKDRFDSRKLIPRTRFETFEGDPEAVRTEIHNYTGRCPTLTYEINPVKGCGVGCQYCLVTDGAHERELAVDLGYHLYVRRLLEEKNGPGSENKNHYYYFSPKTEAFQEASLNTGVAHMILREFIGHYQRCPESKARLFIASKAGAEHLLIRHDGESVLDLFSRLKDRMQFNTSVSIMPSPLRDVIEPYAAPLSERMRAVRLCQERGIPSNSALVQPIFIPCLTDEGIKSFFDTLRSEGIVNYKPEFLTVCMENLAILGPYLGAFDKEMERQLYEAYIMPSNSDHRKQRGRTAPDRKASIGNIRRMMEYTDSIGMSVSICYWVRRQLGIGEDMIPMTNRNGFQCLGYQTRLFGG